MPFVPNTVGKSLYNLQLFFSGYKCTDGISFKGFCNQMKEICEQLAKFQPRAILLSVSYQPRNGFITEVSQQAATAAGTQRTL